MDNLFARIQSLCQEKGIRPGRLCDELNLSRSLMTDLKMGRKKSVSAETAQKIAAFFHVSVGYLLGQEGSENVQNSAAYSKSDILEDVDIAFYGDFKELNEDEKETVRDMVRLMRERRTGKQRN